jgi:predicted transcriptional regulator
LALDLAAIREQLGLRLEPRKSRSAPFRYHKAMEEPFIPEDDKARFLAAVEKGIAAAERGEFIEEDEMDARVERMFKP